MPTTHIATTAVFFPFPFPIPAVERKFIWVWSHGEYSINGIFGSDKMDNAGFAESSVAYHQYTVSRNGAELFTIDFFADNGNGRGLLKKAGGTCHAG